MAMKKKAVKKGKSTPRVVTDALRLLNEVRKYEGLSALKVLPKGTPKDASSCPLATAFQEFGEAEVDTDSMSLPASAALYLVYHGHAELQDDEVVTITVPRAFADFIDWFDNQESPAAIAMSNQKPDEEDD